MDTKTHPHQPAPVPAPPLFALSTDLEGPDEQDVDLDDENPEPSGDDEHTSVEQMEFMGEATSLAAYFCSQLEDLIDPSITWILTCLAMEKVQRRFEGNGRYRYAFESGAIYRVGLHANPKPPPGEDPPGPSMPTRGG